MKNFIVRWTGDCQIEAESLAEAIDQIKKNPQLVVTCSRFESRLREEEQK